ncbi:MAG: heavy metal translocating P-type ATPase [Planctomyces sp.]|nr:heavy metal translocating P-type ATPase [Planctomyces sp.]
MSLHACDPKLMAAPPWLTEGRIQTSVAGLAIVAMILAGVIAFASGNPVVFRDVRAAELPLLTALLFGGGYLVVGLLGNLFRGEFGSDLLAGISIVTSILLGEYLAGTLVVLMLSGGEALEAYAVRRASSALNALAKRMPTVAHRSVGGQLADVALEQVAIGDSLVIFPHETCPTDGTVTEGKGTMDESFLTGEPYLLPKAVGANVLSGAINGESALTIRVDKPASDSRHAKIMEVMRVSEQRRPRLRRLGDQLGAWYTPLAVLIGIAAWAISGEAVRFLAVLVVATPCPLLIAIPVAIIGAVSLSARKGIVIKDPAVLETVTECRVGIFDKTGTLTYGRPAMVELLPLPGFERNEVLQLSATLEQYSRHPLATPFLEAIQAAKLPLLEVANVAELPGQGLTGVVQGRQVAITGRSKLLRNQPELAENLPPTQGGLECIILVDGRLAGVTSFRDRPRDDGKRFIDHLRTRHGFQRVMIVSGDRESEVKYLAESVGITEIYADQTPEQKVAIVRKETQQARTLYVGDGINDAPALLEATVGLAFGRGSDVTAEAAGAVVLDGNLKRVDEFLHISRRLRSIALQSAVGGIVLSLAGMGFAAAGYLPPVLGAVLQEVIDVAAVLNALRMGFPRGDLIDYDATGTIG